MVLDGRSVKGGGVLPCLAVNPLQLGLILADKGIGDAIGSQEIEVDAGAVALISDKRIAQWD